MPKKKHGKTDGVKGRPEWVRGIYGGGGEPPAPEDLVLARLDMTGGPSSHPLPSVPNLITILDNDSRWSGEIVFDEFSRHVLVHGEELYDEMETEIMLWCRDYYACLAPTSRVREAVLAISRRHPTHPVREYLEGLTWDGVPRVRAFPARLLGASNAEINAEMFYRWAISCVARALRPGCKVDTCLILIGPQGTRKSSALRELAGEAWFADTPVSMGKKDAFEQLSGVWVYELAELDSVRRADASGVKAFISSLVDHYRPSYGRNVVTVPRQCVFVGSTNESEFLSDPTGSRRFWPIRTTGVILCESILAERDQIWAEAVAAFLAGERWWLDRDGEMALAEMSEEYEQTDAWTEIIRMYLVGKGDTAVAEVMTDGLGIAKGEIRRADQMRVSSVLVKLGFVKYRTRRGAGWEWRWRRADPSAQLRIPGGVGSEKRTEDPSYG